MENLYDYKIVSFIKKKGKPSTKSISLSCLQGDLEKIKMNYSRETPVIDNLIKKISMSSSIVINFKDDSNYTMVMFYNHNQLIDQMNIIWYDYNIIRTLEVYARN